MSSDFDRSDNPFYIHGFWMLSSTTLLKKIQATFNLTYSESKLNVFYKVSAQNTHNQTKLINREMKTNAGWIRRDLDLAPILNIQGCSF